jgi:hypothetical protein
MIGQLALEDATDRGEDLLNGRDAPPQVRRGVAAPAVEEPQGKSGVSRLCRLAAPGMMKMELGFGSLWLEAGVG